MFIDACAIVSILSDEPDAEAYAAALRLDDQPFTSALAAWEAIMILARPEKFGVPHAASLAIVSEFLAARGIALKHGDASPETLLELAVQAAAGNGAGAGKLSGFDCFHYAWAKAGDGQMLTLDARLRATDLRTQP
jgi:ribonuclease VapC